VRQARDGSQYGGTQSTDISRINRRSYWLRLGAGPGVSNDRHEERALIGTRLSPASGLTWQAEVISTCRMSRALPPTWSHKTTSAPAPF